MTASFCSSAAASATTAAGRLLVINQVLRPRWLSSIVGDGDAAVVVRRFQRTTSSLSGHRRGSSRGGVCDGHREDGGPAPPVVDVANGNFDPCHPPNLGCAAAVADARSHHRRQLSVLRRRDFGSDSGKSSTCSFGPTPPPPPPSRQEQQQGGRRKRDRSRASTASSGYHNTNKQRRAGYRTWPSSEHAAYAFAKIAQAGHTTVSMEEFLRVVSDMNLDFGLSTVELERVFHDLDQNDDGHLSLEEFKAGREISPFAKALVEHLSGTESLEENDELNLNFPDEHFDPTVSTSEYYAAPLSSGFVGEYAIIRKELDYTYHHNYVHSRQRFQDRLIKKTVLLDGSSTDSPWLVHTCGPMGCGKGWVLGWMSSHGYLALERVSKIDPDSFKLRMPEWNVYQNRGDVEGMEFAGTLTHAESSYVAEIAQRVAMNNDMNVWVDGSLRDYEWYRDQFDWIRSEWPQYRIAILAIDAPESTIQTRLEQRAKTTGRHVPVELQKASFVGLEKGLRELTPHVDLIAHISNESEVPGGAGSADPVLKAVSVIDSSGNWDLIKSLTSYDGSCLSPGGRP